MNRSLKLKRNILYVQLYYFFRSFIFAYVIERLFWRSRGISIAETVYIEIIYAITIVIMEVPTGIMADRFSRKSMILLGSVLNLIGSIGILFAYGFVPFAGLIMMSGISGALTSGSVSALIYDSLKEIGESLAFEKYLARIKAIRYGSGLIAALIGGYVASSYTLILPYQMSVVSCFMMVLFNVLLLEPKKGEHEDDHQSAKEIFQVARHVVLNSNFLKYIFVTGAAIGASITYIEEFWQNYSDGIGIDIVYFGIISGAMSLVVLIASRRTEKVVDYLKGNIKRKRKYYSMFFLMSAMAYMALFIIRHPLGILLMLIPTYIEALMDTLVLGDIHHNITSNFRATAESLYSMCGSIGSIVIGLIFAKGSELLDVFGGFLFIGIILMTLLIIKTIYFRKKKLIS